MRASFFLSFTTLCFLRLDVVLNEDVFSRLKISPFGFIHVRQNIFLVNVHFVLGADIEPLQTNLDLEEGYCKALLCRLRFRKVLPCV